MSGRSYSSAGMGRSSGPMTPAARDGSARIVPPASLDGLRLDGLHSDGLRLDGASHATGHDVAMAFLSPDGEPHAVRKVARFMQLQPAERTHLRSLTAEPSFAPAHAHVQERGRPVSRMLVLVAGMASQVAVDGEGRRYSSRFYLPGDIIGAHEIALTHHATDVVTLTGCRFVPVPKRLFGRAGDTRMERLFQSFRQVEQVIASDRIGMLVRGRGDERLLHILLELHARQRLCVPEADGAVWLPMTQAEIGNATGLTNVYVSRMTQRLRDNGTIRAETGTRHHLVVTLNDPEELAERIDFVDRYADLDPAWAAEGQAGGLFERI